MLTLPDYDISAVLSENALTCIYRGCEHHTRAPVILKTFQSDTPLPRHLARLRHEYAMLAELDMPGVARPLALLEHRRSLVLIQEDIGGVSLNTLIEQGQVSLERFFTIALALTDILEYVHRQRIIHRDIKPANIIFNQQTSQLQLIDFGLASRLSREHLQLTPPEQIEGTLPYIAPEQTGRMNRSIDYRADFYSLGISIYQLLTGQLPFIGHDPLDWVHCHIARPPRPPSALRPNLPSALADILLKLLAKLAEERYQSAAGLHADLRECQRQWKASGRITPFALGQHDASDRFQLPQKLYGRAEEVATLLDVFTQVAATGQPALLLVAGYSGIGKSALVSELHRPITTQRGYFIGGKFDQYRRGIPYDALAAAFQSLVQQLLAESAERIVQWRQRLREALGENGQCVIDLVPMLQLITGPAPALVELPPDQARYRMQRVFQQFISVFTLHEHPLVLFLDDLQWVDAASLSLLTHVCAHPDTRYLLVIGAYRDNEVGSAHLLMLALDELRKREVSLHTITLAPLQEPHVRQILTDTLHGPPSLVEPLAQLVYSKARGNPFFSFQFITTLYQDGLLAFDYDQQRWAWDLRQIQARNFTDNVVDLMLGELQRLPEATQQSLALAGFLGNSFELATLALVSQASESEIEQNLWPALQVGLLTQRGTSYSFLHDRVQESAYALTPRARRAHTHLHIGRLMRDRLPAALLEERLFDIVAHLNQGAAELYNLAERRQLALLNQRAAARARAATVYSAAARYLAAGIALLPQPHWENDYALTFALYLARADCEYLAGRLSVADELLDILFAAARDPIDRAQACLVRVRLCMTRGDHVGARAVALISLAELGLDIPAQPTIEHVRQAYAEIEELMRERSIDDLLDLPLITGPAMQMAIQLMMSITTPSYFASPIVWALHPPTLVLLNLRHGNSLASPMIFTFFGFELAAGQQRYQDGYHFCQMAYALMERMGVVGHRGNLLSHWAYTAVWVQPLDKVLAMLYETVPAAIESGDLIVAATASHHIVLESIVRGTPLDELFQATERGLALAAQAQYWLMDTCIRPRRQLVHMLCGRTASLSSLSDDSFDEAAFEAKLANNQLAMGICCYYLTRLMGHVIAGDYEAAHAAAGQAEPILWSVTGTLDHYLFVFYDALTLGARYATQTPTEQMRARARICGHLEQLRLWNEHNAETFEPSYLLVSAELHCIDGQELAAQQCYEQAIAVARRHGFVPQEALANELAARYYRQRQLTTIADMHVSAAYTCYRHWGASAKLRQIEQQSPQLATYEPASMIHTSSTSLNQLDTLAIVKASQAISGQIVRAGLIQTLLQVVLEQAGAQLGALLLADGDVMTLAATAQVEQQQVQVQIQPAHTPTAGDLPATILAYIGRSRERVLLNDTLEPHPFMNDPYLVAQRPGSVLGLPILRQSALMGVLYLEHRSITHIFTFARISVLEQLATQAAIALENAQLYAQIAEDNRTLEQRVAARTQQLADANRELEAFTYSVSHDLRAPLRAINGYTSILIEDYQKLLDADGQRICAIIRSETTRMNELIDDLLTFSQANQTTIKATQIDMHKLVLEVFNEVTQPSERARLDFRLEHLPTATGDLSLLRQVWVNLLSNAVKYSSKRERAVIQVSGSQSGGETLYSVRDNGAGFDMAYLDKLFGVFQRLHSNTEFPGTGVGLAIVQRIIERHGGRIWAESTVDQGATFAFTLPKLTNARL